MTVKVTHLKVTVTGTGPALMTAELLHARVPLHLQPAVEADQVFATAMMNVGPGVGVTFDQLYATVLYTRTPDFRFIDMFVDEEFPHDIGYNSLGAIRFETDSVRVDSGFDQRNKRWQQPLMEYDISFGVRTMEQLHDLKQFFYAMGGKHSSFKYFDKFDFNSQFVTRVEGRTIPDTTILDQLLGEGDNFTFEFQLRKLYTTKYLRAELWRPINKPKEGTVKVAVGGIETEAFEVDYSTGMVTLLSPGQVTATFQMLFTGVRQFKIIADAGTFSDTLIFAPGRRVALSGMANSLNLLTSSLITTISSIAGDGSFMILDMPVSKGANETHEGTLIVMAEPGDGIEVTAGFEFFVPVRFDTDRLPISLEEYGIGGASDVRLVEIRFGAE